jgi:hypothetical protein
MVKQVSLRTVAIFLSGVVMGAAAILFLGGGRDGPTVPAAQAAEPFATAQGGPKDAPQIGRYQACKLEIPNNYGGLLDTATGKVWSLQSFSDQPKWRWVALAENPK